MCGILGQIERERPVDPGAFAAMLETLAARGPDGAGLRRLADDRVALGHRRLAIIDPSEAGAQPIANEDESVWLTFNGEIYNFRELRAALEKCGHRFRSRSDSEVIVHAYEEWGDACVGRLRGIFAFGLWDERRRRLLLARDRLGVKPLYYWRHDAGLVFASQPRAILAHPAFRPRVDRTAFQHYLAYRYVPHDLAIYEGMAKLPAGSVLVADESGVETRTWWRARYEPRVTDPREAQELVRYHIEDAVRSQLVADVPVGLFLSGGIDSSTVGVVASSASREPLASFTVGFDEPDFDERRYARLASEHMGSDAHEEVLSLEQAVALLPDFVDTYDEPFFDHSGLPTLVVSRLARRHDRKVVLAGDGADEVFAGYRWYDGVPDPRRPSLARTLLRRSPPSPLAVHFERAGVLDAGRQAALLVDAPPFDPLAHWRRLFPDAAPVVTGLQLVDLQSFLVDDVLLKVDHASMACGVEVRVPFLDHELVEAAFQIDAGLVFEKGERKALLKRAASAWLPPAILGARKKGFGAPIASWMRGGLRLLASNLLPDGSLVGRGILCGDAVTALVRGGRPKVVWLLLAAELWARRWLDGERLPVQAAARRPD